MAAELTEIETRVVLVYPVFALFLFASAFQLQVPVPVPVPGPVPVPVPVPVPDGLLFQPSP